MSLKIQTRTGLVSDAQEISDLVSELAKRHIALTLDHGGIDSLLTSMNAKAIRDRICGDYWFILAEVENKIIGLAAIRNPSHLYYLFVRTDHQGKGVGRQLFGHSQNYVYRTTGSYLMTVSSSLNSTQVYRRLGFTLAGDIKTNDGVRFQPMRWDNE